MGGQKLPYIINCASAHNHAVLCVLVFSTISLTIPLSLIAQSHSITPHLLLSMFDPDFFSEVALFPTCSHISEMLKHEGKKIWRHREH